MLNDALSQLLPFLSGAGLTVPMQPEARNGMPGGMGGMGGMDPVKIMQMLQMMRMGRGQQMPMAQPGGMSQMSGMNAFTPFRTVG